MLKVARRACAALVTVCLLGATCPAADLADPLPVDPAPRSAGRRTPFVIGAPGRLDAEGDRRYPRRYQRVDSVVAAYADVEQTADSTWLQHEIEGYARRALDCTEVGQTWCRREMRRVGAGHAILLVSGARAELVWAAGQNVAVRLGWRRIVDTPTGSMTLDTPPADFATALLAEFPSRFTVRDLDAASDLGWAAYEIDRLLYYIDQVVAGVPAVLRDEHRRHALRFIEDNLARIGRLRARYLEHVQELPWLQEFSALPRTEALPATLAEQIDAVLAWRFGTATTPWCAAQLASSAWPP